MGCVGVVGRGSWVVGRGLWVWVWVVFLFFSSALGLPFLRSSTNSSRRRRRHNNRCRSMSMSIRGPFGHPRPSNPRTQPIVLARQGLSVPGVCQSRSMGVVNVHTDSDSEFLDLWVRCARFWAVLARYRRASFVVHRPSGALRVRNVAGGWGTRAGRRPPLPLCFCHALAHVPARLVLHEYPGGPGTLIIIIIIKTPENRSPTHQFDRHPGAESLTHTHSHSLRKPEKRLFPFPLIEPRVRDEMRKREKKLGDGMGALCV
ncbi:hypothetical protein FPV67DRAFT_1226089 [Lyophyllum atratum]|nr:hypothetical protein FPV67DRAFT_1226089 [Lyophyllum atratum]